MTTPTAREQAEDELKNIQTHLEVYELRTHRPIHMGVLHVCSEYNALLEVTRAARGCVENCTVSDSLEQALAKLPKGLL